METHPEKTVELFRLNIITVYSPHLNESPSKSWENGWEKSEKKKAGSITPAFF